MKTVREIKDEEMIATFLKAEINSDRWGLTILSLLQKDQIDRKILDAPDLNNPKENSIRKKLLGDFRGYGKNLALFQDFPADVVWKRMVLNKEEIEKVLYIDWDYWVEITDGTRSPQYLAEKILTGKIKGDKEVKRFKKVAEFIKKGKKLPELIIVAQDENSRLVVLEGHVRLTAFFLVPEAIPEEVEVLLGFSKNMSHWGNY